MIPLSRKPKSIREESPKKRKITVPDRSADAIRAPQKSIAHSNHTALLTFYIEEAATNRAALLPSTEKGA